MYRWARALPKQVLVLCGAGALVLGLTPPASASLPACNAIQHIFVRSTLAQSTNHGSTNRILVKDRAVDSDCTGQAISTSQAGTPISDPTPTYVEIGWYKIRHADGSVHLCEFEESQVNGGPLNFLPGPCGANTSLSYGNYAKFRVKQVGTGTDWSTWIDYGNGFILKATFGSRGIDTGIAFGETERKGNGTSMDEDQRNLQDFSQNAWQDWPDANCVQDESPACDWHKQSSNSYTINQNSNTC
jgi:hypothetical protein